MAKCPNCGMLKEEWSNDEKGYLMEETAYCCQGCAEEEECLCPNPVEANFSDEEEEEEEKEEE